MAEGLLRHVAGERFEVTSAGVSPTNVRPEAIQVMHEIGVDISRQRSKSIEDLVDQPFDYVITLCDNANDQCPVFPQNTIRSHWSFEDPAATPGDETKKLSVFRRVRDGIRDRLEDFVANEKTD